MGLFGAPGISADGRARAALWRTFQRSGGGSQGRGEDGVSPAPHWPDFRCQRLPSREIARNQLLDFLRLFPRCSAPSSSVTSIERVHELFDFGGSPIHSSCTLPVSL